MSRRLGFIDIPVSLNHALFIVTYLDLYSGEFSDCEIAPVRPLYYCFTAQISLPTVSK